MAQAPNDFSGVWHLKYWYPALSNDGKEDISEFDVKFEEDDDHMVLQSLPMEDESYIIARLSVSDGVVSGSWQENTSPHKAFKGAIYTGTFQLLLNEDNTEMVGKHVGNNFRENEKRIYTGRFEIIKVHD